MDGNPRNPPEDPVVRLDGIICANCGSSTFNIGIVSHATPCSRCNNFLMSRCAGCGIWSCLGCAVAGVLEARKAAGVDLLAPADAMGASPARQN